MDSAYQPVLLGAFPVIQAVTSSVCTNIQRTDAVEQIIKADREACHALCRTERTEQSEFTNEMSIRAHESPQVTNYGKARATAAT